MNALAETPSDWRGCFADASAWFVELTSATQPHLQRPGSAAKLAAALLGDRTGEALLALTGRRPLPPGFSVLGFPGAGRTVARHSHG